MSYFPYTMAQESKTIYKLIYLKQYPLHDKYYVCED